MKMLTEENHRELLGNATRYSLSKRMIELAEIKDCCPICGSKRIVLEKGDGYRIAGCDIIALHCDMCQKSYLIKNIMFN